VSYHVQSSVRPGRQVRFGTILVANRLHARQSLRSSREVLEPELCEPATPSRETSTGDSRSEYAPPLVASGTTARPCLTPAIPGPT
jgi:hypothetical protein